MQSKSCLCSLAFVQSRLSTSLWSCSRCWRKIEWYQLQRRDTPATSVCLLHNFRIDIWFQKTTNQKVQTKNTIFWKKILNQVKPCPRHILFKKHTRWRFLDCWSKFIAQLRERSVYSRLMGQVDIFSKMKEHICSLSKTNNESLLQLETLKIRYSNMCVCYCFLYLCFSLFSRYLRFAQCQNTYTKTYTLYWAKTVNIHISLWTVDKEFQSYWTKHILNYTKPFNLSTSDSNQCTIGQNNSWLLDFTDTTWYWKRKMSWPRSTRNK